MAEESGYKATATSYPGVAFIMGTHPSTGKPVVLMSSQEINVNVQGPLMPELAEVLPQAFAARIKRQGVVNARDEEEFANACRNTGKRNFVMAGVTTDICMGSPSISAHEEGYNVKVVCDACRSSNQSLTCPP